MIKPLSSQSCSGVFVFLYHRQNCLGGCCDFLLRLASALKRFFSASARVSSAKVSGCLYTSPRRRGECSVTPEAVYTRMTGVTMMLSFAFAIFHALHFDQKITRPFNVVMFTTINSVCITSDVIQGAFTPSSVPCSPLSTNKHLCTPWY